jgi:endo-1,4-beta-D-glucanase Y
MEQLENREVYSANLGGMLTPAMAPPQNEAPGIAHVRTFSQANEIYVGGAGGYAAGQGHVSTQPMAESVPLLSTAHAEAMTSNVQVGGVNPRLAPTPEAGRAAFEKSFQRFIKEYACDGGSYYDWRWTKANVPTMRVQRFEPGTDNDTVSEGIAYGMLMAVHSQDPRAKEIFDQLWNYAKKNFNDNGLMSWRIANTGAVIDKGAATDADQDMAVALIKAANRWGADAGRYKAEAKDLIYNILNHETTEVSPGRRVLLPGDKWGNNGLTHINPSYFAPAYYRLFQDFTKEDAATSQKFAVLRNTCYDLLTIAVQKAGNTGLVPDWMTLDGSASPDIGATHYGYDYTNDAIRTPWRIGLDAVWYGEQRATDYLNLINAFYKKGGVANIYDAYQHDGQPIPGRQNHNPAGISMAATAAIVDTDPSYRQKIWDEMVNAGFNKEYGYYNESLRTLGLIYTSGLMDKP